GGQPAQGAGALLRVSAHRPALGRAAFGRRGRGVTGLCRDRDLAGDAGDARTRKQAACSRAGGLQKLAADPGAARCAGTRLTGRRASGTSANGAPGGAVFLRQGGREGQSASKIPAAPMPVPMHIVTMPYLCFLRRMPWTMVAVRIAPVAPSGWPSAIAPPSGLTLSGSSSESRITASAWA